MHAHGHQAHFEWLNKSILLTFLSVCLFVYFQGRRDKNSQLGHSTVGMPILHSGNLGWQNESARACASFRAVDILNRTPIYIL